MSVVVQSYSEMNLLEIQLFKHLLNILYDFFNLEGYLISSQYAWL